MQHPNDGKEHGHGRRRQVGITAALRSVPTYRKETVTVSVDVKWA